MSLEPSLTILVPTQLIQCVRGNRTIEEQVDAMMEIVCTFCRGANPLYPPLPIFLNPYPVRQIIDAGLVLRLIGFLRRDGERDLQFAAIELIREIIHTSQQFPNHGQELLKAGIARSLSRLFFSDLAERAVSILGEFAAIGSIFRDALLKAGVLEQLISCYDHSVLTFVLTDKENFTQCFEALCSGDPPPSPAQILSAITFLFDRYAQGDSIAVTPGALSCLIDNRQSNNATVQLFAIYEASMTRMYKSHLKFLETRPYRPHHKTQKKYHGVISLGRSIASLGPNFSAALAFSHCFRYSKYLSGILSSSETYGSLLLHACRMLQNFTSWGDEKIIDKALFGGDEDDDAPPARHSHLRLPDYKKSKEEYSDRCRDLWRNVILLLREKTDDGEVQFAALQTIANVLQYGTNKHRQKLTSDKNFYCALFSVLLSSDEKTSSLARSIVAKNHCIIADDEKVVPAQSTDVVNRFHSNVSECSLGEIYSVLVSFPDIVVAETTVAVMANPRPFKKQKTSE